MIKKIAYSFPSSEDATILEVGGKGLSLMIGNKNGLPVPPGFILTVSFFKPWLLQLKKTKAWSDFLKAKETELEKRCTALKIAAQKFTYTKDQVQELAQQLEKFDEQDLFAVRSSSPEEDLEGSSFAGGYETILGVTVLKIQQAVKKAFVSCLDYRVVVYKKENNFAITDPKIAVIIQKQIASDVAGVGFSLNPVTNNFDEAVFTANWGLGETVVAGITTPDTFTVDKVSLTIKNKLLGAKELAIFLEPTGGTKKQENYQSSKSTLTDEQIIELTKLINKVERLYQKPMDIEWAYEKEKLYLLQARPITSFIPLAPEMVTKPGEAKRLYLDVTVTAQAMNQPVSVMGTSLFRQLVKIVGRIIALRDVSKNIDTTVGWISDGKIYFNLSTAMRLAGKKRLLSLLSNVDPLGVEAINALPEEEYLSSTSRITLLPYGLLLQLPSILPFIHSAVKHPEQMHKKIQETLREFDDEIRMIVKKDLPLPVLIDELLPKMFTKVFKKTVPLTVVSRVMLSKLKHLAEDDKEVAYLDRSVPHNMTIEMGLELSHIAKLLPDGLDEKKLEAKLKSKQLPEDFLQAFQKFLYKYGCRGPAEIDIGASRYQDNLKLISNLLLTAKNTSGIDAKVRFDNGKKEREEAYQTIYQKLQNQNQKKAKEFAEAYHFFENFGGYRETHKYYLVFIVGLLREKVLAQAEQFVKENRLDSVGQVFDLTLEQYENAKKDASLNLRSLAYSNTVFLKKLAKVKNPPAIIDSRGFIPSPPKQPVRVGEVAGIAVSPGVVQGRIKVLHTANEKPLHKGEILVARATDPGWTPLFVNAGAVILEIGGVLQHGALVAREYGLPCVAGVENATSLWKDGTLVEVDGTAGIIRVIVEKK